VTEGISAKLELIKKAQSTTDRAFADYDYVNIIGPFL